MRKLFLLFLLATFSYQAVAKKYAQVFYIKPQGPHLKQKGNTIVFENDTVVVFYSFWAQNGVMAFVIFNKLSKPLYVNWKQSSFIPNEKNIPFYSNERRTEINLSGYSVQSMNARRNTFGWISPQDFTTLSSVTGQSITNTTIAGLIRTTQKEQETFIPPKSYIARTTYEIYPYDYFDVANDNEVIEKKGKRGTIYETNFRNGHHRFRNYLSFSFKAKQDEADFSIDNAFYISKVVTVPQREFAITYLDRDDIDYPYASPSRFFIEELKGNILFYDQPDVE